MKITSLAANWELSGKESVYQTIKTLKVCNDVLLKDAGVAPHGHSDIGMAEHLADILYLRPMRERQGGKGAAGHVGMKVVVDIGSSSHKLEGSIVILIAHDGQLPLVFLADGNSGSQQEGDIFTARLAAGAVNLVVMVILVTVLGDVEGAKVSIRQGCVGLEYEEVTGVLQSGRGEGNFTKAPELVFCQIIDGLFLSTIKAKTGIRVGGNLIEEDSIVEDGPKAFVIIVDASIVGKALV